MNRLDTLWCIDRAFVDAMLSRGDLASLMADADPVAVEAMYAARGVGTRQGTVAVVPVLGPLSKRDSMMSLLFGGTSTNRLVAQVNALAADETVATILLNIDSPGGEVGGVTEAAAAIRKARESKPVVAIANSLMGSAAAWLGWQADEVIATPDALVGAQGVFALHVDTSEMLAQAGIKPTYIGSSDAKTGGLPGLPLDADTRAELQAIVDEANRLYVNDTATGRGITAAQVRDQYGNGAIFPAREAKRRGMVDRVATYSETIARLSGAPKSHGVRSGAAADDEPLADEPPIINVAADIITASDRLLMDLDKWIFRG